MQGNDSLTIIPKEKSRSFQIKHVEQGSVVKNDGVYYMRTNLPIDKPGAFIDLSEGRATWLSLDHTGFALVKCSLREE